MRCTALTTFFFALFALFSTMAYAAPVAPQGAIVKRGCDLYQCRDAEQPGTSGASTSSGASTRIAVIAELVIDMINLLGGNNDQPSNDLQPTNTVVTAASSSSAPASDPTGRPQSVPTIKWFTEIAIPSPTPSGA